MNRILRFNTRMPGLLGLLLISLCLSQSVLAQTPQDNWYLEQTWTKSGGGLNATNGGLSSPSGVAVGPDGRIYVGDDAYGRIQVYLPDGNYSFSITNGFGGGQRFLGLRGMITDRTGNFYVADGGTNNCIFVFNADGGYIRRIGGGTGSGDGQLNGVVDVAVASNGDVYVLENANYRVSVFAAGGTFLRKWGGYGSLSSQFVSPASIAVGPDGTVYIAQTDFYGNNEPGVKVFTGSGIYIATWYGFVTSDDCCYKSPSSIRVDPSGLVHVVSVPTFTPPVCPINGAGLTGYDTVCTKDGTSLARYTFGKFRWRGMGPTGSPDWGLGPCHAVGLDGSVVASSLQATSGSANSGPPVIYLLRRANREQWAPPRNAIPMPTVVSMQQRTNSPLVDIDYQVTDMDDTNVTTAMLVFTNGVQSLTNCIRLLTLVEGTATNLGANISANQPHRVTWNAGADWSTSLGNFRVGILAKDSRTNLLDVRYLQLPADRGMPALKISSSPLIQNDFMQAWWWLLATNDPGITLTSNKIYGVNGIYASKILCNGDTSSTVDGRSYIYAKMNVREATVQEVQWASQGAVAGITNQWTPTRVVGGRPKAVNEYGFDTGNWGTNAWWIVPLN